VRGHGTAAAKCKFTTPVLLLKLLLFTKDHLQVIWYFRQRELTPNSHRQMEENGSNNSLVLRNLDESDLGNYTCYATNKMGEQEDTVTLTGNSNALTNFKSYSLLRIPITHWYTFEYPGSSQAHKTYLLLQVSARVSCSFHSRMMPFVSKRRQTCQRHSSFSLSQKVYSHFQALPSGQWFSAPLGVATAAATTSRGRSRASRPSSRRQSHSRRPG
jgi:hypothetical protein